MVTGHAGVLTGVADQYLLAAVGTGCVDSTVVQDRSVLFEFIGFLGRPVWTALPADADRYLAPTSRRQSAGDVRLLVRATCRRAPNRRTGQTAGHCRRPSTNWPPTQSRARRPRTRASARPGMPAETPPSCRPAPAPAAHRCRKPHWPLPPRRPPATTPDCPSRGPPTTVVPPPQVLRLEICMAQHARQPAGPNPPTGPIGHHNDSFGHHALIPAVQHDREVRVPVPGSHHPGTSAPASYAISAPVRWTGGSRPRPRSWQPARWNASGNA
jgi:hypothetical protein